MFRFNTLSEVIPGGGLYPAIWHQTASAQTVDCNRDIVTASGVGGCRIIPPMEPRLRWLSWFAADDVWCLLVRGGRSRTRPPRLPALWNRDFDAVKNAIEMPWSNGQAEGQINRLKTLKRAMYGQAGPELSRARMLPFRHTDSHAAGRRR